MRTAWASSCWLGASGAALLATAMGCGESGEGEAESEAESEGESATANPIGDDALTPLPSAWFEVDDAASPTGLRVRIPTDVLPVSREGVVTDGALIGEPDGFPPGSGILVYLAAGVDPANLPPVADPGASLAAESPTVIVDMATGARVAHWAELDLTADPDAGERQLLILRPAARLAASARYAVALTRTLRARDGSPAARPAGFAALMAGDTAGDARLARLAPRYPEILAALDGAGAAPGDLVLAWDFHTASDDWLVGPVAGMVAETLAEIGDGASIDYAVDEVDELTDDADGSPIRRVRGTYQVPLFLTEGGGAEAVLARDAQGRPARQGAYAAPFTLILPACAIANRPAPLLVYGHGLLGSGESAVTDDNARLSDLCMAVVGTDWTGLSESDVPTAIRALTDVNRFPRITDKLMQAIVNTVVLVRFARTALAADESASEDGEAVIGDEVYYYGNSLGGIMGTAFMAHSPDVTRGVLGVPGSEWGMMFQRSSNWPQYARVMAMTYPDPMDRTILIALGQALFDFSDPINAAPHLLADPIAGVSLKRILIHEAVGDSQVPNVSTETSARTMGIPLLAPSARAVWGLAETAAPADSALVVWDEHPSPLPSDGNVAPEIDNETHGSVRQRDAALEQIRLFLRPDGVIEDVCDGACDCARKSDDGLSVCDRPDEAE